MERVFGRTLTKEEVEFIQFPYKSNNGPAELNFQDMENKIKSNMSKTNAAELASIINACF